LCLQPSHGLQNVQGSPGVDFKIVQWIGKAGGHGDLSGKMEYLTASSDGAFYGLNVAHIGDLHFDRVTVGIDQPL